jgi:hypothetical protein
VGRREIWGGWAEGGRGRWWVRRAPTDSAEAEGGRAGDRCRGGVGRRDRPARRGGFEAPARGRVSVGDGEWSVGYSSEEEGVQWVEVERLVEGGCGLAAQRAGRRALWRVAFRLPMIREWLCCHLLPCTW